jgi:hypothetical protein
LSRSDTSLELQRKLHPVYDRAHRIRITVDVTDNGSTVNAHHNLRVAILLMTWRKSRSGTRLRVIHDGIATLSTMYFLIGVCDFAQKPVPRAFTNVEEHTELQKEHFGFGGFEASTYYAKTPAKHVSQWRLSACAPDRCCGCS